MPALCRVVLVAVAAFVAAEARAVEECPTPSEASRGADSRGRAIAHYLAARRCQDAEDLRCAAAELRQAIDFDRGSPELRTALAEVRAALGDLAAARAEARCALSLTRDGPTATRAHVLLAQIARARDRDREAAALELRQAIRIEAAAAQAGAAPDPEPWTLLATLYLEAGDEAAAARTLDELSARAPAEGAGLREAGRWLLEHGQPGRAERYLQRAVAVARGDLGAWRLLVRVHRALGRSPEVNDDLRAVLDLAPDDPEALLALGRAAAEAREVERARALLDRYQRVAPDRAAAGALVSAAWRAAGRPGEALEAARDAAAGAASPASPASEPRLRLAEGLALADLRRWPEAARVLERVQEQDGDAWVPARVALASALMRAGKPEAAVRALEAPLRTSPGDVGLLTAQAAALEWAGRSGAAAAALLGAADERERLGEDAAADALRAERAAILCRAGKARDAAAELTPWVKARPRAVALRLARADALAEGGPEGAAEAELRALVALAPEEPEPLARLAALLAARGGVQAAAARGGAAAGLDEALDLARRAAARAPRSPGVLGALGRVFLARGEASAALPVLDRAAALSGNAAPALDALGEAYRATGDARAAAAAWKAALQVAGDEPPAVAERLRAALQRKLRGVADIAEGAAGRAR